jgi:hypothetical protein
MARISTLKHIIAMSGMTEEDKAQVQMQLDTQRDKTRAANEHYWRKHVFGPEIEKLKADAAVREAALQAEIAKLKRKFAEAEYYWNSAEEENGKLHAENDELRAKLAILS